MKFTFNIAGCRDSNSEAAPTSSSYPQDSSSSSVGTFENPLYRAEFCALVGIFRNQLRPLVEELCILRWHKRCSLAWSATTNVRQPRGSEKMKANVFHGKNDIRVEEVERPRAGIGEAVIRVTLTTICGTDLHILRGEYPVKPGLIIGHEPVGVIEELGTGVTGYEIGDRVLVGAITPCGQCRACLSGQLSQCGHGEGYEAIGGWRFGNTINGAQAEYLRVPSAQANLAKIPDELSDEQVVLLADIASTGFSGAESGKIRIGDSVVVFAQGPIGLCATAGAKLMGATLIIGVDGDETRLAMAKKIGADVVLDFRAVDVIAEVKRLTGGGADVAIEALGTQQTFESALRSLRPGGTLSSLGVYSGKLDIPYDAFAAGLADNRIVTTLCPGGKERMRRLMEVVRSGRVDLTPLLTHTFPLEKIADAYELFGSRRDGVLKVAIKP
jgi:alcohol dehydrogenase